MRYVICGVNLVSEEWLPELSPATSSPSPITLHLRREKKITVAGEVLRGAAKWTLRDGSEFLVSFKTTNGYLLRFLNLADFFIDESGSELRYAPLPGVPPHTVRHLLLDSVIALALSQAGRLVFHASAVVTAYGACAFAALSGTGKSTLAASFQQAGYQTLTDDCLLLEDEDGVTFGIPSYPGARLRADTLSLIGLQNTATASVAHYNTKRRLAVGQFATERYRLAAVYSLDRPPLEQEEVKQPRVESLSGHDGLLAGVRNVFCLDPHEPGMLVRQFQQLNNLLRQVPILRLTIPDDFAALPLVRDAVLADLKSRGETSVLPARH